MMPHIEPALRAGQGLDMARYYFDLVSEQLTIPDHVGVEVSEANFEESIARILEEIRAEEPELRDLGAGWSIEVMNEEGRRVAKLPL
jgi:Domain of unknown function (DUF6894)